MSKLSSRVEHILQDTISGSSSMVKPRSRVEILLKQLNSLIDELSGATSWIGITTTTLYDGATTNPITINNKSVMAVEGNICSDSAGIEFIFNGTVWQEFGGLSPYNSMMSMDSVSNPGSSKKYARGDHAHPSDTSKQDKIKLGTISLSTNWSGNDPYTQIVTVSGATVTSRSKVDIQLTATQISTFIEAGIPFPVVENNNGILTIYFFKSPPGVSMTLQCTVTEV